MPNNTGLNPAGALRDRTRYPIDTKEDLPVDTPPVSQRAALDEYQATGAYRAPHEQYHAEKPTTPDKPKRQPNNTEQGVRIGVAVAHGVGGILASAFGAGAAVQPLGQLENQALDSAYGT